MKKLKVAAIQAASVARNADDKWAGVDVSHALDLLDRAHEMGADFACFPELYPLIGEEELRARARRHSMYVIAGIAQGPRQRWFNTSTLISPDGEIVGRQTKNYPTAGEIDNGVVAGDTFQVFDTEFGRVGIVICADFAFFNDGVETCKRQNADIIFNPAVWFALSEAFPHTIAGRHLEYSVPVIGVNLARPTVERENPLFPPAGGYSTICVPPPITDLDTLWDWFRTKAGGIDSTAGFIRTLGPGEKIVVAEIDI
ncbi:MAG: carbon-nitrogen hydrolase family protein, partial [Rhizobiaceae bacterium]